MKLKKIFLFHLFLISTHLYAAVQNHDGQTLQLVRERGYLICGVSQGLTGFSTVDDQGKWQGIDVDFCRAVAAAALGDANKVKFVPLSAKERFTSLQSGDIDVLSRNNSWTYLRDTTLGLNFIGVIFYDAQGFLVRKSANIKDATQLSNVIICTNTGTTTELNIADFFKAHQLKYQILTFEKTDETLAAYESGRCDAYSTDLSGITAQLLKLAHPEQHVVLPNRISKEPLSPMVRQGDNQWEQIVRWTLFAIINAEELKINQENVRAKLNEPNISLQRFLGQKDNYGSKLELAPDWVFQVIRQVGNYQDIFERNLGSQSPMKLQRGLNALWSEGGILYAPPFR